MRYFIALFIAALSVASAKLTPLSSSPDWKELDKFQRTITQAEFTDLLNRIYAPNGAAAGFIEITSGEAKIETAPGRPPYILHFASSPSEARSVPRFWHTKSDLGPATPGNPLAGVKIAIDPGHLGGKWAKMEERWFQIGKSKPVAEGDPEARRIGKQKNPARYRSLPAFQCRGLGKSRETRFGG